MLRYAAGKIHRHIVLQIFDGIFGLELFTFLNIGVDQSVGLLNVQPAGDGRVLSDHRSQSDKNIFCLPQRSFRKLSFLNVGRVGGGQQKLLQLLYGPITDKRQHLLFKMICTVLPMFFPFPITLPDMALTDHLLKARVRDPEGLSDIQFLPGECVMQEHKKIQKLIVGILRNAAQKGRNFFVTADGERVFPNANCKCKLDTCMVEIS